MYALSLDGNDSDSLVIENNVRRFTPLVGMHSLDKNSWLIYHSYTTWIEN